MSDFNSIVLDKLDKMHEDITDLKVDSARHTEILAANTESLIIHEKRSTACENRIEQVEKELIKRKAFTKGFVFLLSGSTVVTIVTFFIKHLFQ